MSDTLALVRHGEPTSYRDGGLTPAGRAQAVAGGRSVLRLVGGGRVWLWTSPARRCRETARVVADVLRADGCTVEGPATAPALSMVRAHVGGQLVDVGLAQDRASAQGLPAAADLASFWSDHSAGVDPFVRWQAEEYPTFEAPGDVGQRVVTFLAGLPRPAVVVTHSELIRIATRGFAVDSPGPGFGGVVTIGTLRPEGTR